MVAKDPGAARRVILRGLLASLMWIGSDVRYPKPDPCSGASAPVLLFKDGPFTGHPCFKMASRAGVGLLGLPTARASCYGSILHHRRALCELVVAEHIIREAMEHQALSCRGQRLHLTGADKVGVPV